MRRAVKVKALANRMLLRKAATTASAAARRNFPAWIVADESGATFTAKSAVPRVRDGLVLRAVGKKKSGNSKKPSHGTGAR
jgi:hypothetical protein